jgi:L-histidine Nalpha-methyltransferase
VRKPEFNYRRSVVRSIAEGRVPLKFAYAGRAARTHDTYARTPGYQDMNSVEHEADVLLRSDRCGPDVVEVAEIGPGNGVHSAALLKRIRARGINIRSYLGVDFSPELLEISADNLRTEFADGIEVSTAVWDVESGPAEVIGNWRPPAGRILVCLVGHTLGNFEDPDQVMRDIARALRPGDLLLASVLLRPAADVDELSMAAYRTNEFRRAALEPMTAVGMNASEMDFSVEYQDGAFVGKVTLPRGARLDDIRLPSGFTFRCFMSRRFERDQVVDLFTLNGWHLYAAEVKADSDHMTVVASRAEELM